MSDLVFSVVIPVYNVSLYLEKCITSVLAQSFDSYEIILVDDGSTDDSTEICNKFAESDNRVKVIRKKNGGLVSARNTGLINSSGQYILYLDGDDWLHDDTLAIIWRRALAQYKPDMVVFNMSKVFNDAVISIPSQVNEGFYDRDRLINEVFPYMIYDKRRMFYKGLLFPSSGGKVIRRSVLIRHYCIEEKIRFGEDNAFIFECMLASRSVYFIDESLYMYNQLNNGAMSVNYDSLRFRNNRLLFDYMSSRLSGKNTCIDNQLNSFYAYWFIMAVFHEARYGRGFIKSIRHIRAEIKYSDILSFIDIKRLPFVARMYIVFFGNRLDFVAFFATKLLCMVRG